VLTVPVLAIPVTVEVTCPRSHGRAASEPGAQLRSPDVGLSKCPSWRLCYHTPETTPACSLPFCFLAWVIVSGKTGTSLVICTLCYWLVPSSWRRTSFSFLENQSPSYYSSLKACLCYLYL